MDGPITSFTSYTDSYLSSVSGFILQVDKPVYMGDVQSKWTKFQRKVVIPQGESIVGINFDKEGPMDFLQLITSTVSGLTIEQFHTQLV